jgi:cytochrome c-type biogenesis protein CcmH
MRRLLLLTTLALAVAVAGCGGEDDETPTLAELEKRYICPTCQTTLELSNAPVAERMRAFIRERIAAGDSRSEIDEALIADFGEEVLAAPPKEGFNLLAWVLPLLGGALAVGGLAFALVRWSRTRPEPEAAPGPASANGGPPLEAELERKVDEELARFDG